jgi:hypothetical protein
LQYFLDEVQARLYQANMAKAKKVELAEPAQEPLTVPLMFKITASQAAIIDRELARYLREEHLRLNRTDVMRRAFLEWLARVPAAS